MNKLQKNKEVSFFKRKGIVTLSQLTGGAFTKLLQSLLDGSPEIIMIPAYPLLYLPQHYLIWKKKYKDRLNSKFLVSLILKHHPSLLSTNKMKGYNGLANLGTNKNQCISINKKKFVKNLQYFINQEKINLENIFISINLAYWKTKKYSLNKNQIILLHTHDIFSHELLYQNSSCIKKNILTVRDVIPNLSRRIKILERIDRDRYDLTDTFSSRNYHYYNMLHMWFKDHYRYKDKYLKDKKNYFIKYEDLKANPIKEINKLCKFLKIKFDKKIMLKTTFDKKKWWNDKIYKRKQKNFVVNYENKHDFNEHFSYEFFCLEMLLSRKRKLFCYKNQFFKKNYFNFLNFFLLNFLPTKYELKNIVNSVYIKIILFYIYNCFLEAINLKKMKDYYSNAFYYAKKSNLNMKLIRYNFIRKFCFKYRMNKKFFYLNSIIYFFTKILIYPFIILETLKVYFKRVVLNLFYYCRLNIF